MVCNDGELMDINAEEAGNEFRFINDYRKIAAAPNVKFSTESSLLTGTPLCYFFFINKFHKKGHRYIAVVALRDLASRDELLADYGKQYWDNIQ